MTALERLQELLDEKDVQIAKLSDKLDDIKEREESERHAWTRHEELDADDQPLPVPRLEIRAVKLNDRGTEWAWLYGFVYRHLLGHVVRVPLGRTTVSGGSGWPPVRGDEADLPFRDGAHIGHDSVHLGLQAFAVVEDRLFVVTYDEKTRVRAAIMYRPEAL